MSAAADPLAATLTQVGNDQAWRDAVRAALAEQRAALQAAYSAGEGIERLIARQCAAIDAVVASAWTRCLNDDPALSLLATGGYGRGELYPQSDIDLLVLAEPKFQKKSLPAISRFIALLWDAGLAASHALRSLRECVDAAKNDIATLTSMMELRTLAGSDAARSELAAALAPKKLWPPKKYFEAKREEQRARHARYNDTADNLEPNLKEGPGSLRDLHTVTWMGMRLYGVPGLRALVPLGLLGEDECATLEREWRVLAKLRFGLHLVAPRREERLVFDHQKTLAALMGLSDAEDNLAVEQMMQGFFRAAATMLRINDRLLQRFEEQLSGETTPVPVEPGYVLRHGYLAMVDTAQIAGDMSRVLQLFSVWSRIDVARGLHSETARALAESLPLIKPYREQPAEVRAQFIALLSEARAVPMLKRMARLGVLARYLPEFGKVSGRMQYDLFHVYTVDQHTLTVLRFMDGFLSGPVEGFALPQEVVPRLRKPFLLLIAGLFHDIAKGRGGDHSQLGADDVRVFAEAHELPLADTELLVWLVREHLLMSVTAQRQDISDPEVVTRFATRVADREHLDYLYLLTCADIAGTSPKLWNAWKDRLLADLYTATRYALRRGLENPLNAGDIIADTRNMALAKLLDLGFDETAIQTLWATFPEEAFLRYRPEQLVWQTQGVLAHAALASQVLVRSHDHPGALEIFVRSHDRDGLFAALVATLDRLGMSVLDARILTSTDGYVLDSFQALASAHTPDPVRIAQTLLGALRDPSQVRPARRATPRQLRHFRVPVRVDFDAVAGSERTRLSLVCTDRPGLLADIAQVLRANGLRVHDARIATFGERVEDFFLLSDQHDHALGDAESLQPLRSALIACAEGEQHHGKSASAR
ncbi:MAG TPA: [protein-PII] uridylyltransferase [Arenimonas sp.]|uniref:[protein-PII] uridylyltransferase n=1 Tax=Arenimonas sp. TaxID=1872635 RepID=UPI002CB342B0|nr:[protein-PII] uridylyltransferase [Arenimonas sp.]HMB57265.1 [protein-PII] uridylyltransferase [Arenimonas sp.]